MPEILSKIAAQLIEWLQQHSWVITLLLAIPLAILANLLTDPFKQWMANRSFKQSRKRVKQVESDLHMRLLNRVANFIEYKRDTEVRISKLKTSTVYNADKKLHVQSASYGAGSTTSDVTKLLNSKIVAGRLEILVNNDNLGGDPAPKIAKELRLQYSYDGQVHSRVIPENQNLSLP